MDKAASETRDGIIVAVNVSMKIPSHLMLIQAHITIRG